MKRAMMKTLMALVAVVAIPSMAMAEMDLSKDFDSLGGNEKLLKKARALDPKNRVSIVQKRIVDRNLRLELGVNYGGVMGGDSYMNTQNLGANMDFHFTPRWSIGARYSKSYNNLTDEGQAVFEDARNKRANGDLNYTVPAMDFPLQTALGVISWYPVYGKTNLFDLAVAQFDIYTLAGYGQIELSSGWTDAITAGGGVGLWLSQHVSSRLEARWQTYEDQSYSGARRLHVGMITASLGLLL